MKNKLTMLIALVVLCFVQSGYSWTEPKSIKILEPDGMPATFNISSYTSANSFSTIVADHKGKLHFAVCIEGSAELWHAVDDGEGNFSSELIRYFYWPKSSSKCEWGDNCAVPQVIITTDNKVLI